MKSENNDDNRNAESRTVSSAGGARRTGSQDRRMPDQGQDSIVAAVKTARISHSARQRRKQPQAVL